MAFLRTITNVFKRVSSKTLVGADKEGNKFFTYEDPNDQNRPLKRMVEYREREYPNPRSLHPLWSLWLGYRLKRAPSEKEVELYNEEQRQLKVRIRDIEEQDAKLRLEEMAQREREGRDFQENYTSQSFLKNLMAKMQTEDGLVAGVEINEQALEATKADLARQSQTAQSTTTQRTEPIKPAPEPIQTQQAPPPSSNANPSRPFQKPGQYQQSSGAQQQQKSNPQKTEASPESTWNPNAKYDPNSDL
jgi:NADH:ubiquinone oxidoreductase subunit